LRRGSPLLTSRVTIAMLALALATCVSAPLEAAPSTLRFVRYGTAEGLSESTADAILQDSRGFIWVATPDGLNRFDGHTFKVFRNQPGDATSLSDNTVKALFEDRDGALWVGTDGGVNRYDPARETFQRFNHDPSDAASLSNDVVDSVFGDSQGFVWISTFWGLNRLDPETGQITHYLMDADENSPDGNHPLSAIEDREGRLWIGTSGAGLLRLNVSTGAVERFRHDPVDEASLSHDVCRALLQDSDGTLWIGTEGGGLSRLDIATGVFTRYRHDPDDPTSLGADVIRDIFEDGRGQLWIATDGAGLNLFDRASGTFTRYVHSSRNEHSLASNAPRMVMEDSNGDLWIANYAGGIHFLEAEEPVFNLYTEADGSDRGLSASGVNNFFEGADGELWIGTAGGLSLFDRASERFRHWLPDPADPKSLSALSVRAIVEDHEGMLWAGTFFGGLNRFDRTLGEFTHFRHESSDERSLSNDNVWSMLVDSRGVLWLGTFGGVNRLDRRAGGFDHFRHDAANPWSLAHDIVWVVYEDSRQRIWFGTQAGLSRLDPGETRFVNYTNLSHSAVVSICEDSRGRLWFGTRGGGLNRLDEVTSTFEAIRRDDGLPSDVIVGILEDSSGALWLSTNEGLVRFEPDTRRMHLYNVSDGLQDREFNRSAYLKSRTGELFFGGVGGFNSFFPEHVKDNPFIPPVVLTDLSVFNEPVVVGGDDGILRESITQAPIIRLSYRHSVFSLSYSALSYRHPQRNLFAYRMEGFDRDWTRPGSGRAATYTNLDPGEYVFRVRASNNSGIWNEEGASVRILIAPPWWGTWWFRLLASASFIAGLLFLHRFRTRRISDRNRVLQAEISERRKVEAERSSLVAALESTNGELQAKNEELERFAYSVSHDLQAPLVTIQGFLGYLARDAREGKVGQLEADIERINEAATRMRQLLSDILELSRTGRLIGEFRPLELDDLVRRAIDGVTGSDPATRDCVTIVGELPTVYGDRLRLIGVFQNLVENALHFMGNQQRPRVEIGANREGGKVVCFVRDNGIGIAPEHHDRVLGLFNRLDLERPGTGLGLALVKRVVEGHRGRVWIDSVGAGHGATFYFTLPARPVDTASTENESR
jgi:ligand-binding sensor domain-containing protein/signal transduction histidine kinase